ncbi:hypothetical protein OVA07_00505 [Novosphingobium sp. SL115]|uniref:hypothetical protein n=1 Tax=Novosphingobium sp. SL115 TaxID=2995150 RepID=UPI0022764385|nr:hypothetical protein [Novosphingobium sp. SL115]MCY1669494.1 hypothetical protein [Novosphingobium sp. SL115]
MKLYIWNHPHNILYGGAIAYAVAESEDAARDEIRKAPVMLYGDQRQKLDVAGLHIDGPADRILDLPCAEIFQWEE